MALITIQGLGNLETDEMLIEHAESATLKNHRWSLTEKKSVDSG